MNPNKSKPYTFDWNAGKKLSTQAGYLVRSKQEQSIADLLTSEGVTFEYERRLIAKDGTFKYPDFTLFIHGRIYYWEHWGKQDSRYKEYEKEKVEWYEKHGFLPYLIQTIYNKNPIYLKEDVMRKLEKILYDPFYQFKAVTPLTY